MSDFDKEAERQRLREKYEQDREDREATQRMSELLLQGATMTNRHCDTCGDPIFRYEGQEFCPTCQSAAVEAAEAEARADAETTAETNEETAAGIDGRSDRESESERGVVDAGADAGTADPPGHAPPTDGRSAAPSPASEASSRSMSAGTPADEVARTGEGATTHAIPSEAGDLGEARASLVRTLTRLARAAESTDDPRRAREYLSAAREAAEAVAALDR